MALGRSSNSQTMRLHMSATTARNPQKEKDRRGVGRLFQQEEGQRDLREKHGVHSGPASNLGPILQLGNGGRGLIMAQGHKA